MLKNEVTAQHLVTHPEAFSRHRFSLKSPFSGRICYIVGAEKSGSRVTLTTAEGLHMFVEARRKLNKEKLKQKRG